MKQKQTKEQADLQFFYERLDQVRMSGHERVRAKASLARAEAIAELIVQAATGMRRLLKTLVIRPIRRLATTLG